MESSEKTDSINQNTVLSAEYRRKTTKHRVLAGAIMKRTYAHLAIQTGILILIVAIQSPLLAKDATPTEDFMDMGLEELLRGFKEARVDVRGARCRRCRAPG